MCCASAGLLGLNPKQAMDEKSGYLQDCSQMRTGYIHGILALEPPPRMQTLRNPVI